MQASSHEESFYSSWPSVSTSAARSFASTDCAVADVYGPTATRDAIMAAASPNVKVTGGSRRQASIRYPPPGAAADLHGNARSDEARYVPFDGAHGGAGAHGETGTGDEARCLDPEFLDQRVLTLDQRQRLVQLHHAGNTARSDKSRRDTGPFLQGHAFRSPQIPSERPT